MVRGLFENQRNAEIDSEMQLLDGGDHSSGQQSQFSSEDAEQTGKEAKQTKEEARQQLLQDGDPTFVPTFSSLRAQCLKRTVARLKALETQMKSHEPERDKDRWLDQATVLLRDLDRQFSAIADRHQLEDPEYAAQRGLSLTHFSMDGDKDGTDWMLLTGDLGPESTSITESGSKQLPAVTKRWLKKFCDGREPSVVTFKRRKTVFERQKWAITEVGNVSVPNDKMILFWQVMLGLAFFALIVFLAVGIIATTTTFSTAFLHYFFWIAIVWTLVSSSLLALIVLAFGGDGKDCLSAFLAAVAIWLVLIQIGQTKLYGQLAQGS